MRSAPYKTKKNWAPKKGYAKLNAGGVVILIDHFKQDGQDRYKYIDEYVHDIKTNWLHITLEENELIENHMRGNDFPTTAQQIITWANEIGLMLEILPHANHCHKILPIKKR